MIDVIAVTAFVSGIAITYSTTSAKYLNEVMPISNRPFIASEISMDTGSGEFFIAIGRDIVCIKSDNVAFLAKAPEEIYIKK